MDLFKNLTKVIKLREVVRDNNVFQLHYRVTALLLVGSSILVASKQHFGDPINCITRDDVPNKIMNTYCWIHSTFTLPSACNKTVGIEVAHPCVDKSSPDREDRVYHKYYQWVYFVLFFQAACFYAPHFFWKMHESELLGKLTIDSRNPLKNKGPVRRVARYLADVRYRSRNRNYFYHFIICEVCNFINVILQMYLVDEFLGGEFTNYGLDVLSYVQLEQEDRIDPMVRIFPRMTKCTFHRFGASGDVQRYDSLCLLPLNIINEKIYIVMWFWFVFLAFVSGLWLVYRLLSLTQLSVRNQVLQRRASLVQPKHLQFILEDFEAGDWFLLSMVCKNMDAQWFRLLIFALNKKLRLRGRTNLRHQGVRGEGKQRILGESESIDIGCEDNEDEGEDEYDDGDDDDDDDDETSPQQSEESVPLNKDSVAPEVGTTK